MINLPAEAIELEDIIYFVDGNIWCAVRHDFENLQDSPAGFGETKELAQLGLEREERP